MKELIDSIQNPILRSFVWRVINTFSAVILPALLPVIALQLANNPGNVSSVLNTDFLYNLLYVVVVALVGSAIAGLEKAKRMSQDKEVLEVVEEGQI